MASAILRRAWQGKWAVVTGASAGIGEALAAELAEAGVNLVLTARRRERLDLLAERLRTQHSIQTRVIVADLVLPQAPQQIFDATEGAGLQIDVLINNAGFGEYGEFVKTKLEMQVNMVQVNCTAVVHLSRLFLPAMAARRQGAVMIVASTAAYQPVPYLATYGATKAFDRMLAEALAEEMKRYGSSRECAMPRAYRIGVRSSSRWACGWQAKSTICSASGSAGAGGIGRRQALGHSVFPGPRAGLRPAIRAAKGRDRRCRADVTVGESKINYFLDAEQVC